MKGMTIGGSDLAASRIALGCMRLSDDASTAMASIHAALDAGITFFDHADIYGRGAREQVFSAIWDHAPSLRQQIVLQTKCAIRFAGDGSPQAPKRFDFSYEHIISAVEGSLSRLETDYLDVLLLHRPDALVEPEEVARAFGQLRSDGKVRYFGVSNHTGHQIDLLNTALDQPLIANQMELSVLHTAMLDAGIVTNRSDFQSPVRGDGTLEYCRLHNITIQAWSPLAGGYLGGRTPDHADARIAATASLISELAAGYGVEPIAIPIAWLLRHPAGIQPIIGTTQPGRIRSACQADSINLSREDWYRLYIAGRGAELP